MELKCFTTKKCNIEDSNAGNDGHNTTRHKENNKMT